MLIAQTSVYIKISVILKNNYKEKYKENGIPCLSPHHFLTIIAEFLERKVKKET